MVSLWALSVFIIAVSAGGDVLEYLDSNFDDLIKTHEVALVKFYAPWCGHCKRMAPDFEKASTKLRANDPPVALVKFNTKLYSIISKLIPKVNIILACNYIITFCSVSVKLPKLCFWFNWYFRISSFTFVDSCWKELQRVSYGFGQGYLKFLVSPRYTGYLRMGRVTICSYAFYLLNSPLAMWQDESEDSLSNSEGSEDEKLKSTSIDPVHAKSFDGTREQSSADEKDSDYEQSDRDISPFLTCFSNNYFINLDRATCSEIAWTSPCLVSSSKLLVVQRVSTLWLIVNSF
uniref:protein disulfide-isomerase n=1 Tax=Heterorhabditis bacteriophora TaxID=37862 RepID=A0A1I7WX18_HETBA